MLRKALLVASQLNLSEFRKWINNKLNGYTEEGVPSYRKLNAQLKAKNPYRGLIPVMFNDSTLVEFEDLLTNVEIYDPVESLHHLLENDNNGEDFVYPITAEQQRIFNQLKKGSPQFEIIRVIKQNQIAIILDAIRNKILEWSLKLEEENILGEGIFFSNNEKEKAKMSKQINITNFKKEE